MDFTKYLECEDCKNTGLYCKRHRREVEVKLKIQELQETLLQFDLKLPIPRNYIASLLDSYQIWNA